MENLEERLKQLEQEATLRSQDIPLFASIRQLKGWKKVVAVVVLGLVLFTIVQFVFNLLVALATIFALGVIVYILYRLFFLKSE